MAGPRNCRSSRPPGVVKQDKSSGGSVDTTKTRSGPQRVRMSSGERPMGAAKGKQSDTEALCLPPPCVTFRTVVAPLRGPGQSTVLPFACCVGSLLSVGRCGRCSCWCRSRVRGAQWLVCRGLCWMWRDVPFAHQRRPVVGVLGVVLVVAGVV